jgi:hypothetical protein
MREADAKTRDEADGHLRLIAIAPSRISLLGRRAGHLIDEAGDRLQAAIARNQGEVGADEMQWRVRSATRLPLEAHAIVMRIDVALEAEAIAGEMLLHRRDHRADAVVTVASAMGVRVVRVLGVRARDQLPPFARVPFVPRGDVALDQFVDVAHLTAPFGLRHPARRRLHRMPHELRALCHAINYVRGSASNPRRVLFRFDDEC